MTDDDPLPEDRAESHAAPAEQKTVDAASGQSQREIKKRADVEREQARIFWSRVLHDPIGQREIWRILVSAHTFEERFACGPNGFPQTEATWFHAGEQAFGQRFYQMLVRQAREAVFAMHDQFDSAFAEAKPPRRKRVP